MLSKNPVFHRHVYVDDGDDDDDDGDDDADLSHSERLASAWYPKA